MGGHRLRREPQGFRRHAAIRPDDVPPPALDPPELPEANWDPWSSVSSFPRFVSTVLRDLALRSLQPSGFEGLGAIPSRSAQWIEPCSQPDPVCLVLGGL